MGTPKFNLDILALICKNFMFLLRKNEHGTSFY